MTVMFLTHAFGDDINFGTAEGEMMKRTVHLTVFLTIIVFSVTCLTAQSEKKNISSVDLSSPASEQEELGRYSGDWKLQLQMGAGAHAEAYSGSSTNKIIVGNRFLQIDFVVKNESSNIEGIFILGFDRRNQRYQIMAMDNFGTYFVTAKGDRIVEIDAIKLYGKDDDPHMKKLGFEKEFGYTCRFQDENQFVIEVFWIDTRTEARNEIKAMEYIFSRDK